MSKHFKSPPPMRESLPYEDWRKEVTIWRSFTDIDAKKQGAALFLSLEGKTRDSVLSDIDVTKLSAVDGIDIILTSLDTLYLKDKSDSGFEAFDKFIKYRRPQNTSIPEYISEFNMRYNKLKHFNMILPEGVLAYALLTCANLSSEQEQLARATCKDLTYNDMKKQIERIYTNPVQKANRDIEPFYGYDLQENYEEDCEEYEENAPQHTETAYYGQARYRPPSNPQGPRVNMPDENGRPTQCSFCHSIYHYVSRCPDAPRTQKVGGNFTKRPRGRGGPRGGAFHL